MAWGGEEEQAREQSAGNQHAKNWYDEAMKIVEDTVSHYWNDAHREAAPAPSQPVSPDGSTTCMLGDEYERHRRALMENVAKQSAGTLGWHAELRRYLTIIEVDVKKDMDILAWWAVSTS